MIPDAVVALVFFGFSALFLALAMPFSAFVLGSLPAIFCVKKVYLAVHLLSSVSTYAPSVLLLGMLGAIYLAAYIYLGYWLLTEP